MNYDEVKDCYTCKNGKQLLSTYVRRSKSKTGYISEKTIYQCSECKDCPYKRDCIKGNNCKTPMEERHKVLSVAKTFLKYRKEDLERILSDGDPSQNQPKYSGRRFFWRIKTGYAIPKILEPGYI